MHYKNGRPARSGDQVITRDWSGNVQTGMLVDLSANAVTCNATLVRPVGGSISVTVADCWHAEDVIPVTVTAPAGEKLPAQTVGCANAPQEHPTLANP